MKNGASKCNEGHIKLKVINLNVSSGGPLKPLRSYFVIKMNITAIRFGNDNVKCNFTDIDYN